MKNRILVLITVGLLFIFPAKNFGQTPNLGTAADFVLFTTVGAVTNTGMSHLTGNVGSNSGSSTNFGNVNGIMQNNNGASAQCAADLLIAYNLLNSAIPTFFPAPLLGNGQTLTAGVYSITSPATLNLGLRLDAQGNPDAVFIIQIDGTLSTAVNSKVYLINGAQACKVFWKVEGAVNMAAGTHMKGTIIANNAAISMNTGDTLEGRALSTTGAISINGVLAYTPIGCGSPVLTGPMAPTLASTACYALFSSNGPVSNAGISYVTGDIGTNVGLTSGFNPLFVTGVIHPIPDGSTTQCAADLLTVYTYLSTLPNNIELLYPAQFGHNLVLTPHTYIMNGATTFTDTLYLDGGGVADAVFVLKLYGALSTSTFSKVVLINGTQAKNVYWLVNGAVSINDYSVFKGTIICNNGAIELKIGVYLEGRAQTTTGALGTTATTVTIPSGCITGGGNSLSGTVQYANSLLTPMTNTTVNLYMGNSLAATTTTNGAGGYSFTGLPDGTYTLNGSSTKPWGGGNASDGLIIMKHFVGMSLLSGIRNMAADVDNSGFINATDALTVVKRFVGMITSFPTGNWVFDAHAVVLNGNNSFTSNLKALCYGDVDASYVPALKTAPSVFLTEKGAKEVNYNEVFDLPILTTSALNVSAISMLINYPEDLIEITGITGPNFSKNLQLQSQEELLYTASNGDLRISWFSLKPVSLSMNEVLLSVKMRVKAMASNLNLTMEGTSEIADENTSKIMYVNLNTPKLLMNTSKFSLGQNYPNPTNSKSTIAYSIPENSTVKLSIFNTLGETAAVIHEGYQQAGSHVIEISTADLTAGVYYYKLEAKNQITCFGQMMKMIVSR